VFKFSNESLLENTEKWEKGRIKVNPKQLPKVRKETKQLNLMMGNIIERSVGREGMKVIHKSRNNDNNSPKRKIEVLAVNKARVKIAKNKLLLENILVCHHINI